MTESGSPRVAVPMRSWLLTALAVLLAAASLVLIWAVAVPLGPEVCTAIYPPARNCFESDRAAMGTLVTVLVVVLAVATTIIALLARTPGFGRIAVVGVVLLAVSLLLSYPLVAWIPALA